MSIINSLTILIDRREQKPWTWSEPGIATQPASLPTGDYSLAGHSDRIAIERKSLDDLAQTVIKAQRRWHAELRRMAALDDACIIIEGSVADLFNHRYRCGAKPQAVLGRVLSAQIDFGIPAYFACNRPIARALATAWLRLCQKRLDQAGRLDRTGNPPSPNG